MPASRTHFKIKCLFQASLLIALSFLVCSCAANKPLHDSSMKSSYSVMTQSSGNEAISSAAKLRNITTLITKDLANSFSKNKGLKVVIMPFSEMEGNTVNYLGSYLADKINNELVVASPHLNILERSRIDEVLGELELGMSGLLDDSTVQEAGRALGADAIVVGSLAVIGNRDLPGSEIEVNVRVISVSLMKVVASSSHALLPDVAIWDMMDRRISKSRNTTSARSNSSRTGQGFVDNFNPSTVKYRFFYPSGNTHKMGKYFFNDDAGKLEIRSADNTGLYFSANLPTPTKSGEITVTFTPTRVYPDSGIIGIIVTSTQGDGYEFDFPKSHYKSKIEYIIGGKNQVIWDRSGDSFGLNQKHTMTLQFSSERIIGIFDGVKIFDARNKHNFTVETFTIKTFQMACYIESLEINR